MPARTFTETKVYLTRDEAVKFVRNRYRRGVRYYVRAGCMLYTKTPDECAEGEGPRGYSDWTCLVHVSQKDAMKYVDHMIGRDGAFYEKGVKLQVHDTGNEDRSSGCIFIG